MGGGGERCCVTEEKILSFVSWQDDLGMRKGVTVGITNDVTLFIGLCHGPSSCWHLTADAGVHFQFRTCGICSGKSGSWKGFSQNTSVFPVSIIPRFSIVIRFSETDATQSEKLGASLTDIEMLYRKPPISEVEITKALYYSDVSWCF
jgi:hypothetical protein